MWDRSKLFLTRAGTVILGINIVLWFLATYPKTASWTSAETRADREFALNAFTRRSGGAGGRGLQSRHQLLADRSRHLAALNRRPGKRLRATASRARLGIAPSSRLIAPLGFDWKIGIGIVASFAAREVFVSTMSTVYNVGAADDSEAGMNPLVGRRSAQSQKPRRRLPRLHDR
jgi:ferrous iron transport protein B